MKKILGIALIIFVAASIATIVLAVQVIGTEGFSVNELFDGHLRWHWDDEDDTIRWNWNNGNDEYIDIDEQRKTLPLSEGDTVRVSTAYGRIRVTESDTLTNQVEFSLSGRMPASRTWTVESDKDGTVAYYRLEIPEVHLNQDWDEPGELRLDVTVPRDARVHLDLSTHLGEIAAEGTFLDVDIENNLGSLRFTGVADDLDFQLDLGDANIELYDVGTVTGFVNLGSIDLVVDDDLEGKYYIAETSLGSVQYHGEFYDTMDGERVELRTDLGDIELWRRDIHE